MFVPPIILSYGCHVSLDALQLPLVFKYGVAIDPAVDGKRSRVGLGFGVGCIIYALARMYD